MTDTILRPLDSLQVMAYIIKKCRELDIDVNATKLQKLMYCCYGALLAIMDYRLSGESPEAWQYGPVFPRTLRAFKVFGIDYVANNESTESVEALPQNIKDLIEKTLKFFGSYSASRLSAWSHMKGSPWSRVSDDGKDLYGQIDDATIKSYFRANVVKSA